MWRSAIEDVRRWIVAHRASIRGNPRMKSVAGGQPCLPAGRWSVEPHGQAHGTFLDARGAQPPPSLFELRSPCFAFLPAQGRGFRRRRVISHGAFTLIELMIVLVVIAILLGVLLPNFRGTQDEAYTQRARSEMRTLATALESFYIHNSNAFPAALSSLTSATPLIVSRIPSDPFNGATAYQYATTSGYYVIWSIGINRTVGITGISSAGALTGTQGDDICVTNGTATTC